MKKKPSELFEGENSSLRKAYEETKLSVSLHSKKDVSKDENEWKEIHFLTLSSRWYN